MRRRRMRRRRRRRRGRGGGEEGEGGKGGGEGEEEKAKEKKKNGEEEEKKAKKEKKENEEEEKKKRKQAIGKNTKAKHPRRPNHASCTLLGHYAASSGNLLPTIWDKLSVSSSGVKNPIHINSFGFLTPEDGTNRLSRNVGKKLPLLAA